MHPTVRAIILVALVAFATPSHAFDSGAVQVKLQNIAQAVVAGAAKGHNPVKAVGDAVGSAVMDKIPGADVVRGLYDAVRQLTSDQGEVEVLGRRFAYRFWGGIRGLRGWFWYGTMTDVATGITAHSGGPEHRCRGRTCTVEEGTKNLVTMLVKEGILAP